MKYILSILFCVLLFSGIAQESNKKKVLVVPYGQFDMATDFDLETIAKKNSIAVNQVFYYYQKTLLNSFEATFNENYEFIALKHNTINSFKKSIKFESGKFKGKRYNSVNLNSFNIEDFTNLLEIHEADFVVFVTWHQIKKEAHIKMQEERKRVPYAGHYFDYDVFNLFKQRVVGEGRVKAIASAPNDDQASYSLLRTLELTEVFSNLANHILVQISKPIE